MPKDQLKYLLLIIVFQINLVQAAIFASVPVDGSTGVSTVASYSWDAIAGATSYDIEISTDPTFATTIVSTNVPSNSYSGIVLNSSTVYYWRVRDVSGAGSGVYVIASFETKGGTDTVCGNPNLAIPDSPNPGVNDTITLGTGGNITDVNVSIVTNHTYVGDLIFTLTHVATGTSNIVIDRPGVPSLTYGCNGDNINTTIDDAGISPVENECSGVVPAIGAGPFTPNNLLSVYNTENVAGGWTLGVTDNAGQDLGTFISWCIIPTTDGVVASADYSDLSSSYGMAKHEGTGTSKLGATWSTDSSFAEDVDNASDDGITTSGLWLPGSANAQITASSTGGYLACWFDWDNSGSFEAGEKTIAQSIASGSVNISVTIPAASTFGSVGDDFLETRCRFYQTEPIILATESVTGTANNGEVEDYRFPANELTPVSLVYTSSRQQGSSFSIDWMTTTEIGAISFNVYGLKGDVWILLNAKPMKAKGINSTETNNYHFQTNQTNFEKYKIEELTSQGIKQTYGPFNINETRGAKQQTDSINWNELNNQKNTKQKNNRQSLISSYDFIKLKTTKQGVQRVRFEDLMLLDVDWQGVDSKQIMLTLNKQPVARFVSSEVFGAGEYIEFISKEIKTLYTKTNVYELSINQGFGKSVTEISSENLIIDTGAYQMAKTVYNQNLQYSFASPTDDPWYNQTFLTYTTQKSWDINLSASHVINNGISSTLSYKVWGGTDWPALSTDHHFKIDFNGQQVENKFSQGLSEVNNSITITNTQENNLLTVVLPGDTGADYDLLNLEELILEYPSEIIMQAGTVNYKVQTTSTNVLDVFTNGFEETTAPARRGESLGFTGVGIKIKGLQSQQIAAYAIDDQNLYKFTNPEFVTDAQGLSVVIPDLGTTQLNYFIYQESSIHSPELELGEIAQIPQGQYDYLMITHPMFSDVLTNLVNYHQSNGQNVLVVDVNDIYAWYSNHKIDARAIKQYIQDAYNQNGIEAVLLVGGDSYDYTNNLEINSISYIPSLYIATGDLIKYAPVDSLYADINSDNIPDIAIGRLPVRTEQELQNLIDKTIDFETRSYAKTAVFSSDKDESFTNISNQLLSFIPQDWATQTANIQTLGVDLARTTLVNSIENGVTLTNYFGHSSPRTWSFERLFDTTNVDALNNTSKPTIVNQFGCWSAYYVAPQYNTMAHHFLQKQNSGAVAVMGASTLTESLHEAYLGNLLMAKMTQSNLNIGQAILQSKRELALTHPDYTDVILGWNLLGDPLLEGN